jgi:hypothetical protein
MSGLTIFSLGLLGGETIQRVRQPHVVGTLPAGEGVMVMGMAMDDIDLSDHIWAVGVSVEPDGKVRFDAAPDGDANPDVVASARLGWDAAHQVTGQGHQTMPDVRGERWLHGPSAGLAYAIAVTDWLCGKTLVGKTTGPVVATGKMDATGTVSPVGGVPVKVDGAVAAGARLVLIPAGTQQLVHTSVDGPHGHVDVVRVATLTEAVDALIAHGGRCQGWGGRA